MPLIKYDEDILELGTEYGEAARRVAQALDFQAWGRIVVVSALLVCAIGLLGGLEAQVVLAKDNEGNENTPKIDICQYDSKSFGELEALLKKWIVGSKNSDLKSFFQNTPFEEQWSRETKPEPKPGRIVRIPWGKLHQIIYRCPLPDNNNNRWSIIILEDVVGMVTHLDTYLSYDDENFARRNEPLNVERARGSVALARAILGRNQTQHYDRKSLREEMIAGGFLHHRSCAYDQKVMDIYFRHPLPPDNILARIGRYFYPYSLTNVAITFDAKDGRLLEATPATGPASGRCRLFRHIYGKQSADWLLVNYPDSWVSKQIKKSRAEKQR